MKKPVESGTRGGKPHAAEAASWEAPWHLPPSWRSRQLPQTRCRLLLLATQQPLGVLLAASKMRNVAKSLLARGQPLGGGFGLPVRVVLRRPGCQPGNVLFLLGLRNALHVLRQVGGSDTFA